MESNKKESRPSSKIRIISPDIEAIKRTVENISHWLTNDLKKIVESLAVLLRLPDLFSHIEKTVVDQFSNQTQIQIETEVISRQANVKVLEKKVKAIEKHIREKEAYLDSSLNRIEERYDSLFDDLNHEHESFLRKLDSHSYDIVEKTYNETIKERIAENPSANIDLLSMQAIENVVDRSICLSEGLNKAGKEVENMSKEREFFYQELEYFACPDLEPGEYELPFFFLETQDEETGVTDFEVYLENENELKKLGEESEALLKELEAIVYDHTDEELKQNARDLLGHISLDGRLCKEERERLKYNLGF